MGRYKYFFNGKFMILEKGTKLYDIIDTVDGTCVESYNSQYDVKYALRRLNKTGVDKGSLTREDLINAVKRLNKENED